MKQPGLILVVFATLFTLSGESSAQRPTYIRSLDANIEYYDGHQLDEFQGRVNCLSSEVLRLRDALSATNAELANLSSRITEFHAESEMSRELQRELVSTTKQISNAIELIATSQKEIAENIKQPQGSIAALATHTNSIADGIKHLSEPTPTPVTSWISAIAAALSLLIATLMAGRFVHQLRLNSLLEFSKRYTAITDELPIEIIEKKRKFGISSMVFDDGSRCTEERTKTKRALRNLFLLYWTEHQATKWWRLSPPAIGKKLWRKWKTSLQSLLAVPAVRTVWKQMRLELLGEDPKFCAEIDALAQAASHNARRPIQYPRVR